MEVFLVLVMGGLLGSFVADSQELVLGSDSFLESASEMRKQNPRSVTGAILLILLPLSDCRMTRNY